ncbi:MAG: leucyl aminopeptidase [Ectothiorhodospiraceae bacterium]|jgi:leucyl aminopeptidase|nr:leucyl aminopeptidase [Ectothiorhodospiraceae bacterium]
MEYSIKSGSPEKQRGCVVVGVFEPRRLSEAARAIDQASGGALARVLRRGALPADAGQTLWLYDLPGLAADRVLLVACGSEKAFKENTAIKVLTAAAAALAQGGAAEATNYLTQIAATDRDAPWMLRQAVLAQESALYRFEDMKSKKSEAKRALRKLAFALPAGVTPAVGTRTLAESAAIAHGMKLTRDLANLPGNVCTPEYLAQQAHKLARNERRMKVSVLGEPAMQRLGMGALLAVSKGSEQPARLITIEYKGGRQNAKPLVLVGKGITFDTGGISLKPGEAMDEMKFDMSGAASVLGVLAACAELKLPLNVTGIIAAAENMPDGKATRPGDVVTSMSGQTVEILNTDAEGRLVLCDALTYAQRFEPEAIIDIATLTGACIIALGHNASAVLGNDDKLVNQLLDAGRESWDRAWQLPLWDDYQDQLKSNFADFANIGGRPAGTITAACFLARFTKEQRWAHLDIAGTAWKSGEKKGATGRPVPLLVQFLLDRARRK